MCCACMVCKSVRMLVLDVEHGFHKWYCVQLSAQNLHSILQIQSVDTKLVPLFSEVNKMDKVYFLNAQCCLFQLTSMLFQITHCLFYYNLLSECITSETSFFFLWHHKGDLQPFASNQLVSFWYLTPSFHNPKPYPHCTCMCVILRH